MASIATHHAEWLSLVDVSGPFLSVPVLKEALPNGLDAHDPHVAAEVRAALEQWADPDGDGWESVDEGEIHQAFVRFVLHKVLGFDEDTLRWDDAATSATTVEVPHVGVLTPDAVVMDGEDAVMLVAAVGPGVRVDQITSGSGTLTPQERMVEHLKASGLRVGLVTDGERWTLVSYREGENPGFATWWSSLWGEEKITLQAFRTLLHQDRFLAMGSDETIVGLLDRSVEEQSEVTTKLGNQTLQAVEILIRTIDRIDHERGGELLRDVPVAELYDAAVTVMMRLVFLFYAEENDLLPVAEPLYNERYAASTLRERLQAAADQHGEEVLETTHDGWPRLLATWRAVFGGVEHADMVLAPYGGSLFDPDRYPFLEGRQPVTSWTTDAANPLPIDNRTVLHLLNALQTLDEGGMRRKLSFLSLDVEQIGHVYEGMLEHTAARANGWVLGFSGTGDREPEIELTTLVSLDEDALLDFLKEQTGRAKDYISSRLERGFDSAEAERLFGMRWGAAFPGDDVASSQARRFAPLIRGNSSGEPTVFQPGSVYVADSAHRSATGTHYTPRSLTHEILEHTLARLVYEGPDLTENKAEWKLRTSDEILNLCICDPACGSGAFLVQACRYLSARVVEARVSEGTVSEPSEDHLARARREVAERCLHGVDINPMACEMAKLSLWLTTLAIDKPFSFLDHAIKCGDSLIGITDLSQIARFDLRPLGIESESQILDVADEVAHIIEQAKKAHEAVISTQSDTLEDISIKSSVIRDAAAAMALIEQVADELAATTLANAGSRDLDATLDERRFLVACCLKEGRSPAFSASDRRPLHWPLAFPHLKWPRGFDAIIANPPFLGSQEMNSCFGEKYRSFLVQIIAGGRKGKADLVGYFALRFAELGRSAGFLATNSICQGDSLEACLGPLIPDKFHIARAWRSLPWPNKASVFISKIWVTDEPVHRPILEGEPISTQINAELYAAGGVQGTARALAENRGLAHQGYQVIAAGLQISQAEADLLLADPDSAPFVRHFVNGISLHAYGPGFKPGSYCIDFGTLTLPEARRAEAAFSQVERKAKDEVLAKGKSYDSWKERWWQFWSPRPELRQALADKARCFALVRTSKVMLPVPAKSDWCLSDSLIVFALERWADFAVLSSAHHWWWAISPPGTGGSSFKSDPRYTASVAFETFPRPYELHELEAAGESLHDFQVRAQATRKIGLKALTNLVNDPECKSADITALRDAYVANDLAVGRAYSLQSLVDVDLDHDFYDCGQLGTRFTISAVARRRITDLLLEENFRRYADSVEGKGACLVTGPDGVTRLRLRDGRFA